MSFEDHERRRDELAAYLLGALEPAEAAELERHLAGCEECRAELSRLRPAVQALPETVERVKPPAKLRASIMAETGNDAERGSSASPSRRWRLPALRPASAVVAALLLIAAGVGGYAISDGDSGGDTVTVASGTAPGVTATMVSDGDTGTLRLANVRALPRDEVLQAWVRRDQRVESANSLFVPNPDGTATTLIDDMRGVETVMVTAEPHGGSDSPTSKPLVSLTVPQ
jgi:anti-sigma-K factor RskA